MRIAVAQFAAGADVAANTAECVRWIGAAGAAEADLVVLPELSMFFDPRGTAGPGPHGQPADGEFAGTIRAAAARWRVAVIVGMLESAPAADTQGRDYNTVLAIGSDGDLRGSYRKIHLYDAFGFRESDVYLSGEITAPLVIEVAGCRVAALTCYDLRFPEIFRWAIDAGAEVVALPAAWVAGPAKEHHWTTLLAARAIENTVYIAASGQTGPVCCGQSMVIDPMGAVIAGVGDSPGLAVAEIDTERIAQVRSVNPSLDNRRFTVAPR